MQMQVSGLGGWRSGLKRCCIHEACLASPTLSQDKMQTHRSAAREQPPPAKCTPSRAPTLPCVVPNFPWWVHRKIKLKDKRLTRQPAAGMQRGEGLGRHLPESLVGSWGRGASLLAPPRQQAPHYPEPEAGRFGWEKQGVLRSRTRERRELANSFRGLGHPRPPRSHL